ncbi:hypothetical protein E2C01_004376 [Portunus trituberculatus]|uniref:Uncharacterized protein n=1 Tax=Portunus trituberculatus TaxID=210409 RepID=A0A5B7CSU8_PORTR|nr:hypothetical protein [Portunus trituberculatus]
MPGAPHYLFLTGRPHSRGHGGELVMARRGGGGGGGGGEGGELPTREDEKEEEEEEEEEEKRAGREGAGFSTPLRVGERLSGGAAL